jgi:uncharacterized membrane protein YoaK (UPF0700 family)
MFLFKSKRWPFWDIVVLKVYCALLGVIVGAYIASFVKSYVLLFVLVVAILLVRLFYFYFLKED